ncbi:MAG: hypothetical protein R2712_15435 [Vicinamibacterales bacterium]
MLAGNVHVVAAEPQSVADDVLALSDLPSNRQGEVVALDPPVAVSCAGACWTWALRPGHACGPT